MAYPCPNTLNELLCICAAVCACVCARLEQHTDTARYSNVSSPLHYLAKILQYTIALFAISCVHHFAVFLLCTGGSMLLPLLLLPSPIAITSVIFCRRYVSTAREPKNKMLENINDGNEGVHGRRCGLFDNMIHTYIHTYTQDGIQPLERHMHTSTPTFLAGVSVYRV